MMIEQFDKKELYLMEKILDNFRDDMLKGLAQHFKLATDNREYGDKILTPSMKSAIATWDTLNSICHKLEKIRLEEKKS